MCSSLCRSWQHLHHERVYCTQSHLFASPAGGFSQVYQWAEPQGRGEYTFHWPGKLHNEVITITAEQWQWLLVGYNYLQFKGHKALQYTSVGL